MITSLPCLVSTTVKTKKTETKYPDWLNALTYLYPNKVLCPNSAQCFNDCLKASGRLTMNKKKMVQRTKLYFQDFEMFYSILFGELCKTFEKAVRGKKQFAYRPNGTSDDDKIVKRLLALPKNKRPFHILYDYTKIFTRVLEYSDNPDYHLTFSFDGINASDAAFLLENSIANVSVIFDTKRGEALPDTFSFNDKPYKVIDGDLDDLRHFDESQVVVGLRAKGKATKNDNGFVVSAKTTGVYA